MILACLQVPALPLQVLLRAHPDWRGHPVAVVDADRPQGKVLWVNEAARRARVLPGMRYAPALLLCRDLRAGVVATAEVEGAVGDLLALLGKHAPSVEPSRGQAGRGEPGVFWLNATGMVPLHASVRDWADAAMADVTGGDTGYAARLAVGSTRFGTWAVVHALRARRPVHVFPDADAERRAACAVRLDRLPPSVLPPALRDTLARLDVHTVGRFLELPSDGLGRRFGREAAQFHRFASGAAGRAGAADDLLDGEMVEEPLREEVHLEFPETDVTRLLFLAARLIHPLRRRALDDGRAVRALTLDLRLEDGTALVEVLRPAAATLDTKQMLELVHLRLEALRPGRERGTGRARGVETFAVELEAVTAKREQLPLFRDGSRRVAAAADRALARIRADLGEDAVVYARLRDAHLPEARFTWERLERVAEPRPRAVAVRPLVRRLHGRPQPLPDRGRREPDGWLLGSFERGPVVKVFGPYDVSGGWWVREVSRSYRFLETKRGDLAWVYYDRRRRRWFQQGLVE